jgi:tetratricopeptide (TPR) repeat protein
VSAAGPRLRRAGPGGYIVVALGLCLAAERTNALGDELRAEVRSRLQRLDQAINDWDLASAKKELAELEQLGPESAEPLQYFQGRIAFEEGRYAEAIQLFSAAGLDEKPGSYLRLASDTQKIMQDHRRSESEHFIFFYPKGKDEVLAPYALETLESIRRALSEDLGFAPAGKVRVEVVNDARELSKVSTLTYKQIITTGTIAICKFNKLMITSPKAVLHGYDWRDTLAHEFVHLVVSQKSHNTVPIWLHEGLAKYLESRWRGGPALSISPSTLALLGDRVKKDKLIPFERMHPSIALLPSPEDAATAFAEVFFAVDLIYKEHGAAGLRSVLEQLAGGKDDKKAIEAVTRKPFAAFEKSWLSHVRAQPFPKELIPLSEDKVVLKDQVPGAKKESGKKGREISFSDFAEVSEPPARKFAHLGELMRERGRAGAAVEEFAKARSLVGDKYESISNKYALSLLELRRLDEAEKVLQSLLAIHPGSPATNVHLGRIYLSRKDMAKAKGAYLEALAADPFDEEIHLSLLRIHGATGAKALAQRARDASVLLTGLTPEKVDRIASALGRENRTLAEVSVPEDDSRRPKAEAGAARDAGR